MKKDYYNNNTLYIKEVNNAIIPSLQYPDGCCKAPTYGGVYSNGKFIDESLFVRYYRHYTQYVVQEDPSYKTNRYVTDHCLHGTYIFGGYIMVQYGHFIIDTLPRLWLCEKRPDLPVIFVSTMPRGTTAQLCPKSQEILVDILGIKNSIVIPYSGEGEKRTELYVQKLLVPTPGLIADGVIHKEYSDTIAKYKRRGVKDINKLWISRKNFFNNSIKNIEIIETVLEKNGWNICDIEKLPTVSDQLEIIARAKIIAGFEGSSFHNVLLMHDSALDSEMHMLTRGRNIPMIYDGINKAKNLNARIHDINIKESYVVDPQQIYDLLI